MARKNRNKQDHQNTVGRKTKETKFKINCLSENVIIIRNNGKSVKVKADNQIKEISYRKKPKKLVGFLDAIQSSNTITTKDIINNIEEGSSQKKANISHALDERVVNPNAILADINRPKRKHKKGKKYTMTGAKANKPNKTNELRKELHEIFVGYRHMTGKIENKLNRMGFSIKRKRNHIILSLPYNGKIHTFTISISASDNRCGYKIVSNIMNAINL